MAETSMLPPPILTGYSYIRPLGSGGFADVYLFDQNMPRRRVAIKVLRASDLNPAATASFRDEANVTARMSSHPAILTIFDASVSSDGRPYIAMEHCTGSYSERYKAGMIPVPEVLRTGVKIGGALQSLHQSGFLHRDIKPSNILVTEFGLPVLGDFSIAASLEAVGGDVVGMSVPWSAPEVINERTAGSVQSEVYSFAATLFTLFQRYSPAQIPGADNSRDTMSARIRAGKQQPLTRPDVPGPARDVITRALSNDVRRRPQSIAEMVAQLQRAELALGLAATTAEYATQDALASTSIPGGDSGPVVVRSSVVYESRRPPRQMPQFEAPHRDDEPASSASRGDRRLIMVLAGVAVVAIAVIATILIQRGM